MRARAWILAGCGLALLASVGVSIAQAPPRPAAKAAIVAGTLGDEGRVAVAGEGNRRSYAGAASGRAGATAAGGETLADAPFGGGARAVAVARSVKVLDGLVTAYGVRRTAAAQDGAVTWGGSVEGLVVAGRVVGDVTGPASYDLDGYGTLTVLSGEAGLRAVLTRPYAGHPAGTVVKVALASASAPPAPAPAARPERTRDNGSRAARGTGARRASAAPRARSARPAARRPAARRPVPRVRPRLTGHRFTFPVFGRASFSEDFGAARRIGPHAGTDVFAPFGAPVVAVQDGVVLKVGTLPISGNRLWLRTRAGDEFFYAHLSAFAPAARNGNRVRAGTVLGFVGTTGDAERTPPHVHFEVHPSGGEAVDPYPFLRAWRARRDVPPGAWLTRYGTDTAQRPGTLVEVRDFISGG